MPPEPTAVPLAKLLEHRAWVRRLAGSFVRDEASVDDLEQETWLAALRRPPRREGALRGWLSRVVRGRASNALRAAGRRRVYEERGARPEPVRSAGAVVAEAEIHKRLVVAVLELGEPYRTTVLMRYFDGVPPREIGRGMDVPVETVRTRLRRALASLRDGLSGGGSDPGWLAALAPLGVLPEPAGVGGGAVGALGTGIAGGTIMTGKTTILAAATLALGAGYLGAQLPGLAREGRPDPGLGALAARLEALESAPGSPSRRPPEADAPSSPSLAGRKEGAEVEGASDLAQRIQSLEEALAAARATNAALVAWASGLGPPPRDAAAEARGLEQLSDAELFEAIRKLSTASYRTADERRMGFDRVIQACGVYLARSVEPAARGEVLTIQGGTWLRLGEADRAESALEEALRVAGPASREGHTATVQLAFTASSRKDNRRAADLLFGLARQPETARGEQAYLRVTGSSYLATVDAAGARAELRAVVEEFGGSDDPSTKHWVESARKALERLEAASAPR